MMKTRQQTPLMKREQDSEVILNRKAPLKHFGDTDDGSFEVILDEIEIERAAREDKKPTVVLDFGKAIDAKNIAFGVLIGYVANVASTMMGGIAGQVLFVAVGIIAIGAFIYFKVITEKER